MKYKEVLSRFSQSELCEIYDKLNGWEWDERLGEKPERFDELPSYNIHWYHKLFKRKTKDTYIAPAMAAIEKHVSKKELWRYHHVHNLGHTDEQFEQWWRCHLHNI